jgi:hypothetical protein
MTWREEKMTTAKIVLSNSVHSHEARPLLRRAALMLATLVLLVAAEATVATAQTYTDLYDMGATSADPITEPPLGAAFQFAAGFIRNSQGVF